MRRFKYLYENGVNFSVRETFNTQTRPSMTSTALPSIKIITKIGKEKTYADLTVENVRRDKFVCRLVFRIFFSLPIIEKLFFIDDQPLWNVVNKIRFRFNANNVRRHPLDSNSEHVCFFYKKYPRLHYYAHNDTAIRRTAARFTS